MIKYLKKDRWSPFIVGFFLALLSIFSFYLLEKMLGTSRTFVKIAAGIWSLIDSNHVQATPYFRKYIEGKSWIDWQFALVIGIFIGSYFAGNFFQKSPVVHVPSIWKERFGNSRVKRYVGAFFGGMIILIGARIAGGCTSGHGIAGGMQLATTGWLFMVGLFGVGVPAAFLIYTKRGGK